MYTSEPEYLISDKALSLRTIKTSKTLSKQNTKTLFLENNPSILLSSQKCLFCDACGPKEPSEYFSQLIDRALYIKYSSSQNYYYTKEINDLINNAKTPNAIRFKDLMHYEEEQEYLKRPYRRAEYRPKIKMLTEYYKYHKDVPRVFISPVCDVLNYYHDKRRRLEYYRVTKMLDDQKKVKRGIFKKVDKNALKPAPITDRILVDLEQTEFDIETANNKKKTAVGSSRTALSRATSKGEKENKGSLKEVEPRSTQPRDISSSHTINELNLKLGEIINNSYNLDKTNYFDVSHQHNETISNLDNFLKFMQASGSKFNDIPVIVPLKPDIRKNKPSLNTAPSFESISNLSPQLKPLITNSQRVNNQNRVLRPGNREHQDLIPKAIISSDLFDKKVKVFQITEENRKTEPEKPFSPILASRPSADFPGKNGETPKISQITVTKIKNFDEAVIKPRHIGSPLKANSHRSGSKETSQVIVPASLSSRKDLDQKPQKEEKSKEIILMKRRESQTKDLLKNKSIASSSKLSTNNQLEKHLEILEYGAQSPTAVKSARLQSPRELRISVDIKSLHKPTPSQEYSTNFSTTVEALKSNSSRVMQTKVVAGTLTSLSPTIRPQKVADTMASQTTRELKSLANLGLIDSSKTKNNVPTLPLQKLTGQPSISSARTVNNMDVIPERSITLKTSGDQPIQQKAMNQTDVKFHHKHTKSEDKGVLLENHLDKKVSLPYAVNRSPDNSSIVVKKTTKNSGSSSARQLYAFNQSNVVNVYSTPQAEKTKGEHSGLTTRRNTHKRVATGFSDYTGITTKVLDLRPSATEGVTKFSQISGIRTEPYGTEESPRSPIKVIRKEELRLSKPKSKTSIFSIFFNLNPHRPSV